MESESPKLLPPEPHSGVSLRPWGRGWRICAILVALVILVVGQVRNDDDLFPLGSLAQYASAQNLNGSVRSVFMTADFPVDGENEAVLGQKISLNQAVVGVGRGEIEGQLQRFIEDPELLAVLGRAYVELNPGAVPPEALYLKRSIRSLKDGTPTGEETIEVIVEWHRN